MVGGLGRVPFHGHAKFRQAVFKIGECAIGLADGPGDALGDGNLGGHFGRLPPRKLALKFTKLAAGQPGLARIASPQAGCDGKPEKFFNVLRGLDATKSFPFASPDLAPVVHAGSYQVDVVVQMLDDDPRTVR